ncbi:MAG TPA: carboxylating nicotinate-nucleotide diphosphorylase [Candidatus Acidoferrales bacterium]|jgi:nicotinate-nucleotide pyrophosphorylase (carboxylating)|nr:carboxylating nicotinate-nucleotide diphosphorylase [Candidatus Acidoferrales bacterium]
MNTLTTREQQVESALFRGAGLTLQNPDYACEVRILTESWLRVDLTPKDLTVAALELQSRKTSAIILAREPGIAAGCEEFASLAKAHSISVRSGKNDGDTFQPGDTLLHLEGEQNQLLSLERVGLNLLQRMCGIATRTRCLQERAAARCPSIRIVATRKTVWGLLDKRAVHLGRGGTHRLGLADAILIKNNHLALISRREEDAVPVALTRAWNHRHEAAFIEIEVRGEGAALRAADSFRKLQKESGERYPSLLLLDNFEPREITSIIDSLRRERLWDYVLIEASGGISQKNIESYADTGVDAISVGELTHSVQALDLCQRIS